MTDTKTIEIGEKTTTLNRILACDPCGQEPEDDGSLHGWLKLLKHLGKTEADDEPLPYSVILESNGLRDALWAMCCEPRYDADWRIFAVACARRVEHLMEDPRSIAALDVAERFARGDATEEELDAARADAWDAERAAAEAARWSWRENAAKAAAAAARAATWDAAWAAAWAAWAAWAADTAAFHAEQEWQRQEFLRVVAG